MNLYLLIQRRKSKKICTVKEITFVKETGHTLSQIPTYIYEV